MAKLEIVEAETIELAKDGWGWCKIELALASDGRWYVGHNYNDACGGTACGANPDDSRPSLPTRQAAMDAMIPRARAYLRRRMTEEHAWRRGRVVREAREMLRQIDAAYPPPGTQFSMF